MTMSLFLYYGQSKVCPIWEVMKDNSAWERPGWTDKFECLYWNCLQQFCTGIDHCWLMNVLTWTCLRCQCPQTWTFGTTTLQCWQLFHLFPHCKRHSQLMKRSTLSSNNASGWENENLALHITFLLIHVMNQIIIIMTFQIMYHMTSWHSTSVTFNSG